MSTKRTSARPAAAKAEATKADAMKPEAAKPAATKAAAAKDTEPPSSAGERVARGVLSADEALAQYGRLIGRLLVAGELEPYMLAVTSAVPGEGVTSICVGLAAALAASTVKDVALVDANLRCPALHTTLGLPGHPGLHEVVAGNEGYEWRPDSAEYFGALSRTAAQTEVPNLWLVPSGAPMANPAQLTTSDGARAAMKSLRARFNYSIVDCPPVLTAVDAVPICRSADAAVIVMRAGLTPREQVKRAQELLKGVPIMGVILNGV
jgi:polysaccharide biosynthesis transport protein